MTVTQDARELMRAAYENRYTWDRNFPGYKADIAFDWNGTTYTGQVRVNANLSTEITGIEDESAKKLIAGQLQEIAIHRIRRSFDDTHSKNTFDLDETDETGAVKLLVGGKSSGDYYKICNNEVVLVHRHIHGVVVTINTFSSHQTEGGYLSHTYDSVYHDPQTGEQKGGKSFFEDQYTKVGDYYILSQRTIRTEGMQADFQDFAFSNIALLQPAVATAS
ncbi:MULTISPECIES: DUF3386 domain-containing protein [unclassified Leptolyngbya]|uniref:DUF3386 domain-containing protein n=1 Tax=unclassified Leptolyngbya TaxID=2650499 RepID=UPI00168391B3|nr:MULTISPECIES: DUF3386 domain-containing protein [unclassified Leptolyngbya]MBD1910749.1 DUF3386 domain-containing protein [Leptolyngbya sp. FACHB-8]MBD2158232.1 DUF3386 domain-containing protein [Leptolyngbya sp. FACHB-16]